MINIFDFSKACLSVKDDNENINIKSVHGVPIKFLFSTSVNSSMFKLWERVKFWKYHCCFRMLIKTYITSVFAPEKHDSMGQ